MRFVVCSEREDRSKGCQNIEDVANYNSSHVQVHGFPVI